MISGMYILDVVTAQKRSLNELTTSPTFQASGLIDKMGGVDEMAKSTPTQRLGEPEVSNAFLLYNISSFHPHNS